MVPGLLSTITPQIYQQEGRFKSVSDGHAPNGKTQAATLKIMDLVMNN
jgi:hypothetical protein